jgi:hypothetical protein
LIPVLLTMSCALQCFFVFINLLVFLIACFLGLEVSKSLADIYQAQINDGSTIKTDADLTQTILDMATGPLILRIPYGRVRGSGYNACTGKYCIICPRGTQKNKTKNCSLFQLRASLFAFVNSFTNDKLFSNLNRKLFTNVVNLNLKRKAIDFFLKI